MEDGTLAVIFALWALLGLDPEHPFARAPADPGVTFSAGETIVNREANGYELRVEVLRDHRFGPLQPTLEASMTEGGGVYLGSGFRQQADLGGGFYVAGSGVTGLWLGEDVDLGQTVEFRTTFEIGHAFGGGLLGIGWDHRSNAELGRINPGLEVISLRYTRHF